MANLPVVCVFGVQNIDLKSEGPAPDFETRGLDCRCYLTDDDLGPVLVKDRPQVIVSFGEPSEFPNLLKMPESYRRMWLNFDDTKDIAGHGVKAFYCFIHNALQRERSYPLVSVFTPAYKSGDRIMRPYNSLLQQDYIDWEWVIVDDSDDGGETWEMLSKLASTEPRIRLYREREHSGNIGNVKRTACDLCRGEYLVELDHDDELAPEALGRVSRAYQAHPEVGFVYTDFAECWQDGGKVTYGEGWGFGYGSYREEDHGGIKYMVVNSPHVNAKTIRHIVAAPNHIRSWRKSVYNEIGGHNDMIHVVDDYELMVRTFLHTRMARVPHMCYVQYRSPEGNTHQTRNKEIQRLVRYISCWYDQRIHERLLELGVDDFIWKDGEITFNRLSEVPNQEEESHCTLVCE